MKRKSKKVVKGLPKEHPIGNLGKYAHKAKKDRVRSSPKTTHH
jgi:hypothetical protein